MSNLRIFFRCFSDAAHMRLLKVGRHLVLKTSFKGLQVQLLTYQLPYKNQKTIN